jgi:UDPglucose 6-dehydrogenase
MECVVVGAGYVGLVSAIVLAERGHEVQLVEVNAAKGDLIRKGKSPIFEPGVEDALQKALASGRLTVSEAVPPLRAGTFVFICVGTPSKPNGAADLSQVKRAAQAIGKQLPAKGSATVVVKSTVPPSTTSDLVGKTLARAAPARRTGAFVVASNPEFLREGRALVDARNPDRIVVGCLDQETAERIASLWGDDPIPRVLTVPTTAELIKYAANAFLAAKVSFANEMALLSQKLGVDVYDVMHGIGLDARIGKEFLRAGAGFGGSCFPKDVRGLVAFAKAEGVALRLPKAVLEVNERQPAAVVDLLRKELGTLRGKRVALLGLAFKPDTDDVRETRALPMYQALVKGGAKVTVWDPIALPNFLRIMKQTRGTTRLEEALRDVDAAVIQTEWGALRDLPAARWKKAMRGDLVIDGRRSVDAGAMRKAGLRYVAIGDGRTG